MILSPFWETVWVAPMTLPLLLYGLLTYRWARVRRGRRALLLFAMASPALWLLFVLTANWAIEWAIAHGRLHQDFGFLGHYAGWIYGSFGLAVLGAIALTTMTRSWRVGVFVWAAALLIWLVSPQLITRAVLQASQRGHIPMWHAGYWVAGISAIMWHGVVAVGMFWWAREARRVAHDPSRCRSCRYPLAGLPEPEAHCPECGAPRDAQGRIGHEH